MSTASAAYDQAVGQVVDMMVSSRPFAQVEDAIDSTPVGHKEQTALWRLAWSIRSAARRRTSEPADVDPIGTVSLRDGSEIRIEPADGQENELLAFMQALSPQSRRWRFGSAADLPRAARLAARADGSAHLGAVALDDSGRIVGHATCVRLQEARAEVAVAVDEDRRQLGLATILLALLARKAEHQGIRDLTAEVPSHNFAMCSIFRDRFRASAHQVQRETRFEFPSCTWRLAAPGFERLLESTSGARRR